MFLSLVLWWQKDGFDSFYSSWVSLHFCVLNLLIYNSITLDGVSVGWNHQMQLTLGRSLETCSVSMELL